MACYLVKHRDNFTFMFIHTIMKSGSLNYEIFRHKIVIFHQTTY
jgi:hypothetical protein